MTAIPHYQIKRGIKSVPQYYQYMTGICLSEKPEQGRINFQGALARLPSFLPAVRGLFSFLLEYSTLSPID